MPSYEDFQEIAHCGGQVTFTVYCDAEGRRSFTINVQHSRPTPAAMVGIYALAPHGLPVADFNMGGLGDGFDPPLPEECLPVFLGSDSRQCWGHQCPGCHGYFRNGIHTPFYRLTCPYCGIKASAYQFLTQAQRAYITHYVDTLVSGLNAVEPGTERELVIDMDAIADQSDDQPRPNFYYTSEAQQTRYHCDHCGDFNDIRGRFGYCASCGWRNNFQSLNSVYNEIRDQLNSGQLTAEATVRAAVSEFDACCRDFLAQIRQRIPMKPARKNELQRPAFHDIDSSAIARMKNMFDIDILRNLDNDTRFVRMMMHRRHIYEHNAGVADERYVRESGDTNIQEGTLIRETQENAHRLIACFTRMIKNLDNDFHEIFPPTEWPIDDHQSRRQRG